jgi:CheY-like chemotaxis protein
VGFRILLVDDETDLLDTLVRLLRRSSHTCLTASSAEDAILLIRSTSPELLVTDLHLPGLDGLAVARFARERNPRIPVILMTAYSMPETHARTATLGGTYYLKKPFNNGDFLKTVENAIAGA